MSKKRVQKYIPQAIKEIEKELIEDVKIKKNNQEKVVKGINKAFNGYISSFGASIIQSGLRASVALFENQNNSEKTKASKHKLMRIVLNILKSEYENLNKNKLLEYIIEKNQDEILTPIIKDISVAIKLTIRTYPLGDPKEER